MDMSVSPRSQILPSGFLDPSNKHVLNLLDKIDFSTQLRKSDSIEPPASSNSVDPYAASRAPEKPRENDNDRSQDAEAQDDDPPEAKDSSASPLSIDRSVTSKSQTTDPLPTSELEDCQLKSEDATPAVGASTNSKNSSYDSAQRQLVVKSTSPEHGNSQGDDASGGAAGLSSAENTLNGKSGHTGQGDEQPAQSTSADPAQLSANVCELTPGQATAQGLAANSSAVKHSENPTAIPAIENTDMQDQATTENADPLRSVASRRNRNQRWFERTSDQDKSSDQVKLGPIDETHRTQDRLKTDGPTATPPQTSPPNDPSLPVDPNPNATVANIRGLEVMSAFAQVNSSERILPSTQSIGGPEASTDGTSSDHGSVSRADRLQQPQPQRTGTSQSSGTGIPMAGQSQSQIGHADRVRLIQRVARSFSRLGPDGGNVQLRLHPPELGALAMQVRIERGSLSAHMLTESPAAREVILDSLPQLRSRLAQQGFEVTQISVDVGQVDVGVFDGSNSSGNPSDGQSNSSRHPMSTDMRRASHLRRQLDSVATLRAASPRTAGLNSGIDLHA